MKCFKQIFLSYFKSYLINFLYKNIFIELSVLKDYDNNLTQVSYD